MASYQLPHTDERAEQIRSTLSGRHVRPDILATTVFCVDVLLFACLSLSAMLVWDDGVRLLSGFGAGFITLRFATITHDAGHPSHTSSRRLNKLIARVTFLPAL